MGNCTSSSHKPARDRPAGYFVTLDWPQFVDCLFDETVTVEELTWNDKFRTPVVLQTVLERRSNALHVVVVEKLGWFFAHFCISPSGRDVATSNQVYDFIVNRCFPRAKNFDSARRLANAIGNIVCENRNGQRLFSTAPVVNMIVASLLCYRTDECAFHFGVALSALTDGNNLDAQKLVAAEESSLAAIEKSLCNCATSVESVQYMCRSVGNITNGVKESRAHFSSSKIASALAQFLENRTLATPDLVSEVAYAISGIVRENPEGQKFLANSRTSIALTYSLAQIATTHRSVEMIGLAISRLTFENREAIALFTDSQTVTALVSVLDRFAVTAASVSSVCNAIGNITSGNRKAQLLFSHSDKIIQAFTSALSGFATTPESVSSVGFAIGSITHGNPQGQDLFSPVEIRAAIANSLRLHASTADAAENLGFAIANITYENEELKAHFATPEIAVAIATALGYRATTPDSVFYLCMAITNITSDNADGQKIFASVRELAAALLVALLRNATTAPSARLVGLAISNLLMSGSPAFFTTPEYATAILDSLDKYATTPDSAEKLVLAINNIVAGKNRDGQRFFTSQRALLTLTTVLKKFTATAEPASITCRAIGHLCQENREGQKLFTNAELATTMAAVLENCVQTEEGLENFSRAVAGICTDDNADGKRLFGTAQLASAFLKKIPALAASADCVQAVCQAISSIVVDNDSGCKYFSSLSSALTPMEQHCKGNKTAKEELAKCLSLLKKSK